MKLSFEKAHVWVPRRKATGHVISGVECKDCRLCCLQPEEGHGCHRCNDYECVPLTREQRIQLDKIAVL